MNMNVTKEQRKIAKQLGVYIAKSNSFNIVAAKIRDHVSEAIGDWDAAEPTEHQVQYAKSLGIKVGKTSRRVISARIGDELLKRNIKALKKLKLEPGDIVTLKEDKNIRDYVISSIKDNGKIYFKGIGCPQAWATQIDSKLNDES